MFRLRRIELYAIREPSADMVTCVTNGAGVVTGSGRPAVFPDLSSIATRHRLTGPPRPLTK